jgi:hypothetical protein
MPHAAEFLSGFGLIQGHQVDGYTLISAHSTHESISRYQEYKYKITLQFRNDGSGDYNKLFYSLSAIIGQEHIIYGVRNPYRCVIDPPQHGDIIEEPDRSITVHLLGHSYRTN